MIQILLIRVKNVQINCNLWWINQKDTKDPWASSVTIIQNSNWEFIEVQGVKLSEIWRKEDHDFYAGQ